MKIALLRVGVDSGSGGIQGPLFKDGSFVYLPIPDCENLDSRTYGNTYDKQGKPLAEYFPKNRQPIMAHTSMHVDPEFTTFTYGDPTPPKAGLRYLQYGDMLIFYCGLAGWDFESKPALYLLGYFEVTKAGYANSFSADELDETFKLNFHVRHKRILERQKDKLILVKGSPESRLLNKAVCISTYGQDRLGRPLKILSPDMQSIFGTFGGKLSIQRSPTRWIEQEYVSRTANFIRSLE